MAELHKFQDDVRSEEGRVKAIVARYLDENFRSLKLEISDNLKGFIKITNNFPQPSKLEFVVSPPSAEASPVFSGGQFSHWEEIEDC